MHLAQHLRPELILLNPQAADKWALLKNMVSAIVKGPFMTGCPEEIGKTLADEVLAREREQSTAFGDGFALPHARVAGLPHFLMALALCPDGFPYDSPDGPLVKVVCMVITPLEDPTVALKVVRAVSQFLSDEAVRHFLMNIPSSEEAYRYIQVRKPEVDLSLTARDVMRLPRARVHPETPLREVSRVMHRNMVEAVPVTDEGDTVVGEIRCDQLFQHGIPDFFSKLKSISFIRHFDPFEKYFAAEGDTLARDIMAAECCCMTEDATLLEVVFALTVQRHPKVYVTRDGRLVGIVDRNAVLERILNL